MPHAPDFNMDEQCFAAMDTSPFVHSSPPARPNLTMRRAAARPKADEDSCDRLLVLRAQSGDRGAFNLLVRKYRHRVMKLAMRYLRNQEDAEDTVQDIFMRAYWGLRHFRGDSEFYSWLHRIAINSAKTAHTIRARHARRFPEGPQVVDESGRLSSQLTDLDTPENRAVTEEICAAVNLALGELCEEQRAAIVLRDFDGLSYLEVASLLSCPVGTVRSRMFRAREAIDRQLRRVFEDGLGRSRGSPSGRAGYPA